MESVVLNIIERYMKIKPYVRRNKWYWYPPSGEAIPYINIQNRWGPPELHLVIMCAYIPNLGHVLPHYRKYPLTSDRIIMLDIGYIRGNQDFSELNKVFDDNTIMDETLRELSIAKILSEACAICEQFKTIDGIRNLYRDGIIPRYAFGRLSYHLIDGIDPLN